MRKHPTHLALAAVLGLGGLATGVVVAPAMATAATTQTTPEEAVGDRVSKIKEALSGLVSDGTITQEQADSVATTLDEQLPKGRPGHGGPGGRGGFGGGAGLEAAADTLGVPVEELRTALRDGQSLADVAETQGVSTDDLVAALVEAAEARLADAVTDGRLTQEQADERAADLPERIGEMVEREGLGRGGRGGPPPADAPAQPEDGTQESTPAEPSSLTA